MFRTSKSAIALPIAVFVLATIALFGGRDKKEGITPPEPVSKGAYWLEPLPGEKPVPYPVEGIIEVKKGDSLWKIHKDLQIKMPWWRPRGSGWWQVILTANPELRPTKGNLIYPGQRLLAIDLVSGYPMG